MQRIICQEEYDIHVLHSTDQEQLDKVFLFPIIFRQEKKNYFKSPASSAISTGGARSFGIFATETH
jgi:hypothetical protein